MPSIFSRTIFLCASLFALQGILFPTVNAQPPETFRVVGYYAGDVASIDSVNTDQLSHIIFSFGHLCGNRFCLANASDTLIIQKMIARKATNPSLKVMLSLGGWGGCKMCSDVFSTATGRTEFAHSVKETSDFFHADGIDLDWEYPVIPGFPEHRYAVEDRDNFTALVKELRKVNGHGFEITFAAGGFTTYIDQSIAWNDVLPDLSFINLMTYDLVHGNSIVSGHHTPLYSTDGQLESTDHAVKMLLNVGVPADKIVIGAAFYGRIFQMDQGHTAGLYQPAHFLRGFSYKDFANVISPQEGFEINWDDEAKAPYALNVTKGLQATYDNPNSMALKVQYAKELHLGGIMFWQLMDDRFQNGLLQVIADQNQ